MPLHTIRLKPVLVSRRAQVDSQQAPGANGSTSTTSTTSTSESSQPPKTSECLRWRPFWYRRRILVIFWLFFAIVLAGLQALHSYSQKHNGIIDTTDKFYYLWTYGPTALLTLVLALWNRLDYRIRQMAPWQSLVYITGASPKKSIFLDYLSPTRPEILWMALRNRHWVVAASTLIGLLQVLLIVLSTALLTLTPVMITTHDVQYKTDSSFIESTSTATGAYSSIANSAPYIYDAILALNLSYPLGTTSELAYQTFSPTISKDVPKGSIQKAVVDVLTLDFECEPAQLQLDWWEWTHFSFCPSGSAFMRGNVTSNECNMSFMPEVDMVNYGNDGDLSNFAFFEEGSCNNSLVDYRIMLGYGIVEQKGYAGPPSNYTNYTCTGEWDENAIVYVNISSAQSWICKPVVALREGTVSYNSSELGLGTSLAVEIADGPPKRLIPHNSTWGFQAADTNALFDADPLPKGLLSSRTNISPTVDRILRYLDGEPKEDLVTTDLYLKLSQKFSRGLFAQLARLYWTEPGVAEVPGSQTIFSDRLQIREIPVRLMEAALGTLLVLTTICNFMLATKGLLPYDPASLSGLRAVLTESAYYTAFFRGLGRSSLRDLKSKAGNMKFRAAFVPHQSNLDTSIAGFMIMPASGRNKLAAGITIMKRQSKWTKMMLFFKKKRRQEVISQTDRNRNCSNQGDIGKKSWRPIAAKLWAQLSFAACLIFIVVALEVLLSISSRSQGIADTSPQDSDHLAWTLVPAVVMAAGSLYLGALDSTYRTFAPYLKLKMGGKATETMEANYLSPMQIEVLGIAMRHKQFGVSMTTVASMLSAFLTIVVSGVFSQTLVPSSTELSVVLTSSFFGSQIDDDGSGGNSALISYFILQANLSSPTWTYQNLAIASVDIVDDKAKAQARQDGAVLEVVVPAIRSSLACTLYTQDQIPALFWYTGYHISRESDRYGVITNIPGDSRCALENDVHLSSEDDWSEPPFSFYGFTNNSKDHCPSLNFFWGRQTTAGDGYIITNYNGTSAIYANATHVDYARALSCYETIDQVDVEIALGLDGFKLQNAPVVRENSTKMLPNAILGAPYNKIPSGFFPLLNFAHGFSQDEYDNPDKMEDIIAAIHTQHGIFRAQQYNAVLREPLINQTGQALQHGSNSYSGTLRNPNRYRLKQHAISTHLLCALLGTILLLGILSYFLVDTRDVLPKNPSSIAAMTSFLVDSNALWEGPPRDVVEKRGWKWWRKRKHQSACGIYKMGWFERNQGTKKVFTIDRIDKASFEERTLTEDLNHESEMPIEDGQITSIANVLNVEVEEGLSELNEWLNENYQNLATGSSSEAAEQSDTELQSLDNDGNMQRRISDSLQQGYATPLISPRISLETGEEVTNEHTNDLGEAPVSPLTSSSDENLPHAINRSLSDGERCT